MTTQHTTTGLHACSTTYTRRVNKYMSQWLHSVTWLRSIPLLHSMLVRRHMLEASGLYMCYNCDCTVVTVQLWQYNCDCAIVSALLWQYICDSTIVTVQLRLCNCDCTIVSVQLWFYNCVGSSLLLSHYWYTTGKAARQGQQTSIFQFWGLCWPLSVFILLVQ